MTTNNDADDFGTAGKEQRPQVTLDLKATEVRSEPTPANDAGGEFARGEAPQIEAPQERAASAPSSTPRNIDPNIQSFATHMTAGLVGSLFALVLTYYGAGAFRDRLPLLTDRSAQDFQTRISSYDTRFAKQDDRFGALDKNIATLRPDIAQVQSRIQALAEQNNALKQDIAALAKRLDERPAVVSNGAPSVAATSEAMAQNVDPLKAKIADLEGRLAQMSKSQTEVQTDGRASAVAVALYGLRRAVAEGKPFAAELQALSTLTPAQLDLTALNANREKGVPNIAQLQANFDAAANAAIDADGRSGEGSYFGEVWARAKSLVRVRRVGEVPGDDTQAVIARVEMRLGANDLRAALAEGAKLKGQAAAAFKPWLDAAQARLTVDESIARVEAALLATLGTENSVRKGS